MLMLKRFVIRCAIIFFLTYVTSLNWTYKLQNKFNHKTN